MHIVVAPDSYKGCLAASQVAFTIKNAWETVFPEAKIEMIPMADGGEGTIDALLFASRGIKVETCVTGPLMQQVVTQYGVLEDIATVVIEIAQVAGLLMVPEHQRNPMMTTSYGVGELLLQAMDQGYRRFIIGLGGSATNEGGLGMLKALGGIFLDSNGQNVSPIGASLKDIHTVNLSKLDARIRECTIIVASDVENTLCGPRGATFIFGPQKGAIKEQILELDASLCSYAQLIESEMGLQLKDLPGAGAAGGLGFALLMLGAQMNSGARVVMEAAGLADQIKNADWVITGEGQSDYQTLYGKLPFHVAKLAKEHKAKAILISGGLGEGYERLYDYFVSCHSITLGPISLNESMLNAEKLLFQTAMNVARLVDAAHSEQQQ
ncbi:glycerate kinase [Paenibacillus frigoriresistens]|uniref:glycerate kinase n=1 Tax=Paenibacillus alginolyticus TaxID=59839 RepID=UPI0015677A4F|nr:glycerate kinase [Paenibacillus frigoriresistens]NRF95898.1 glycerate kinase [Paenibacillus frigoriresistens]